jgi:predicted aconitase
MFLTDDERRMLDGESGRGVQRAMELLVALGEAFDAEKMIDISRAHVSIGGQESDIFYVEELVAGNARCKVPPTINPDWDVDTLVKYYKVSDHQVDLARKFSDLYGRIGAVLSWSCTPALMDNVPVYGEHIAFAESSAAVYANSVLGALTNRESSQSALAAAVIGRTPEYGLHLAKNRKGTVLVNVEAPLRDDLDWKLLGWYIGRAVGLETPVIKLPPATGTPTPEQLLNMGAAMNTSGTVPLFHIPGVTPEAIKAGSTVIGKRLKKAWNVTHRELDQLRGQISEESGPVNMILLGCPHYTLNQIREVATALDGRQIRAQAPMWIQTSFHNLALAERMGYKLAIESAGAHLVADTCIDQACWGNFEGGHGLTDSPKCAYYRSKRGHSFKIASLRDCLRIALNGASAQ